MVSSISAAALPLLLLSSNYFNCVSADTCEGMDPIACRDGGVCRNGKKDYENLLNVEGVGFIRTEIRGMYCECPDDTASSEFGLTGVHCMTTFEKCNDDTICFNGGFCEHNSENYAKYHCGCPQDDKYNVYAGRACEIKVEEEDFCSRSDTYFDVVGSRWFCVNGGKCIDNEE